MSSTDYIIIPGTQEKVYEDSVVVLFRLPDTKWILHCGYYTYNGVKQKGWYFSSIPATTVMPVFLEDLVAMRVISGPQPCPPGPIPPGPCPPGPFPPGPHPPGPFPPGPHPPGPHPPAPIPIIFTPEDKKMLDASMITVETLEDRDRLGSAMLDNGKVVRVNNVEGKVDYFEWDSANQTWIPATLGYRYMTRDEITEELNGTVVDIVYSDNRGVLTLVRHDESEEEIELTGVVHDPVYQDFKLRIPVFGKPDLIVNIPKGSKLKEVKIVENYEIEGHIVPALVIVEEVNGMDHEIATDISSCYNLFKQVADTNSIDMYIESATNSLKASVKIADVPNNAIHLDSTGLYVDISGKADKKDIALDYLLVADGLGGFTSAGNGIKINSLQPLSTSDRRVPTENIVAAAIQAAIEATIIDIDVQLRSLDTRVTNIEGALPGPGVADQVVTTTTTGLARSGYTIGSNTLSSQDNTLATERAVKDAISWKAM